MKADVLQLVSDLAQATHDATMAETYYYDIIKELGEREILTNVSLIPTTLGDFASGVSSGVYGSGVYGSGVYGVGGSGVGDAFGVSAQYTLPDAAVRMLGAFFSDRYLNHLTVQEVESYAGSNWRDIKNETLGYVIENESKRNFRLFPKPVEMSKDFIFVNSAPLGEDYPNGAVAVAHTEVREDLPPWLELPVVFEILAREYARESDHRDVTFASMCRSISNTLFEVVLA